MRQKTNYILVGAFVIAGGVLTMLAAILLGAGALSSDKIVLETYLRESVQGLEVGSHVRFRGVKLGAVTEIGWTSIEYGNEEPLVLVRFTVKPFHEGQTLGDLQEVVATRLGEGLRARLASQGLTGALYLEADLFPDADTKYPPMEITWTPKYRYVPSIPSTIAQLGDAAQKILANLQDTDFKALVADLRNTLAAVNDVIARTDLPALSGRVGETLGKADGTLDRIREAILRLEHRADATLAKVESAVGGLDPADVRAIVTDLRAFAAGLEPTRASLDATLADLRNVTGDLRTAVRARGQDIDAILEDTRRIAESFANLADTLEHYPSLLLLGTPPPKRNER